MSTAAIYDPSTGLILRVATGSPGTLLEQVQEGEALLFVPIGTSDATHHVEGGVLVAGALDLRTLAERKAEKWNAMKRARSAFEFGGFTWDGSAFDSDPASQSRIQGAAQLALLAQQAGQPFSIDWTLQTNDVRTLSGADVIAVGMAMGQHIATAHAIGRSLRDAIEAATTIEALEQLSWN